MKNLKCVAAPVVLKDFYFERFFSTLLQPQTNLTKQFALQQG
jgi:hypothetical protein